jgi:NAD(P)-dependent dehydrogenase (short-subunit alcohol dehydrogenase family)
MSLTIERLFAVRGKVAVVTGASRGIGRMIAQGLAENGVKVYITGRSAAGIEQTSRALEPYGTCVGIAADLFTLSGVRALAAQIAEREPRIHILVNNAGCGGTSPIDSFSEELWDEAMNLNAKTPFFLTQALLPQLRAAASKEDPARVLNMSSGAGTFVGGHDMFSYGASKAAGIHITRSMAFALAPDNINVNAMIPGVVVTEMLERYLDQVGEKVLATVPTRKWSGPEEMAGMVLYLCSRAGANTTGAVIMADGGQSVMPLVRE